MIYPITVLENLANLLLSRQRPRQCDSLDVMSAIVGCSTLYVWMDHLPLSVQSLRPYVVPLPAKIT